MLKKRLFSLFLLVVMLVSVFPIGVSAAKATVDGVSYTVVSTSAELSQALAAGGNILLKNDIELDSAFAGTVNFPATTVLNGNGFSLTYKGERTAPLFRLASGTAVGEGTGYMKNIGFGTKESPMLLTAGNSLFVEEGKAGCLIIYQNVDFFVKGTAMKGSVLGGIYTTITGGAYFYGCTMHAELEALDSSTKMGGWIGEVSGDLVMNECTTYGSLSGAPTRVGGAVGQIAGGYVTFTNCINLASVTGKNFVAGFVGNVGTSAQTTYFTGCINYGAITATGSDFNAMAGGILGRSSNIRDQGNERLRVFYDCINYGTINSGSRAGGIVGASNDEDVDGKNSKYLYYTFENCVNLGAVSGKDYAGGMIGIASPATYCAEITDCINVGKIVSSAGYAGNFGGMLSSGVIKGGYAAGVISTKQGTDVLAAHSSGNYKMTNGSFANQQWAIVAPTVSGVGYIGNAQTVGTGITKIASDKLADALKAMSELCNLSFVSADSNNENAYVVCAEPAIRGVQQSVAVTNGKVNVRLIAGIGSLSAYRRIGFKLAVYTNGKKVTSTVRTNEVYTALNSGSKTVTAAALASNYFYTATLNDITLTDDVVIEVTPYAVGTNGTEYTGQTRVISCQSGTYGVEPMTLNGALLEDYAIVYASTNALCEELLANRMADEIAQLTGIAIPVFTDAQTSTKEAKILVGPTKATTAQVKGRTLCTQSKATEIVISGTDTAQLSEAISYFLDTIEKKLTQGERSWSFESVTVPANESISLMGYNLGAKNNAYIKKAEWNMIVDYLPDIITFQEPWAGFLDDFLNDYAVQPKVKFFQNSADDDVMRNDVDNKCFTGNGYYGVYWGLPRWKPGDATEGIGKASYSVILYAKDRFTVDISKSGTFWLSDTVDVSGSKYEASKHVRCATYATMTDKNTGKTFIVVNTHLGGDAAVKTAQAKVLLRELKKRVGNDIPVFITGDMNSEAGTETMVYYKNNKDMPMTTMDSIADYAYRHRRNIDWLLTNCPDKVEVSYYKYCGERPFLNNLWNDTMIMGRPSDHPAVYAEFKFR